MASKLTVEAVWHDELTIIDPDDPVQGGADGIDNQPHIELMQNDVWLKTELAKALERITALENKGTTTGGTTSTPTPTPNPTPTPSGAMLNITNLTPSDNAPLEGDFSFDVVATGIADGTQVAISTWYEFDDSYIDVNVIKVNGQSLTATLSGGKAHVTGHYNKVDSGGKARGRLSISANAGGVYSQVTGIAFNMGASSTPTAHVYWAFSNDGSGSEIAEITEGQAINLFVKCENLTNGSVDGIGFIFNPPAGFEMGSTSFDTPSSLSNGITKLGTLASDIKVTQDVTLSAGVSTKGGNAVATLLVKNSTANVKRMSLHWYHLARNLGSDVKNVFTHYPCWEFTSNPDNLTIEGLQNASCVITLPSDAVYWREVQRDTNFYNPSSFDPVTKELTLNSQNLSDVAFATASPEIIIEYSAIAF